MEKSDAMLHDKDLREPLFLFLEEHFGKNRIFGEKTIGRARADVVMVTPDSLYGIEIKSDADTYARLASQVRYYNKYFDRNILVSYSKGEKSMGYWVLSVRTSLPDVCNSPEDLKTSFWVFDNFEAGKTAFLQKLKEFAFSENEMFDRDGRIVMLSDHRDTLDENDTAIEGLMDPGHLGAHSVLNIESIIRNALLGNDVSLPSFPESSTNWWIAAEHDCETLTIRGDGDGPVNGCDPYISMNIFDLTIEKSLHFHVNDMFGQEEASSELYVDLIKAEN